MKKDIIKEESPEEKKLNGTFLLDLAGGTGRGGVHFHAAC